MTILLSEKMLEQDILAKIRTVHNDSSRTFKPSKFHSTRNKSRDKGKNK